MILENVIVQNHCYSKNCELFNHIKIGSIQCTGYPELDIKPCKFYSSHVENNNIYLSMIKEMVSYVSQVNCNRPTSQLKLF